MVFEADQPAGLIASIDRLARALEAGARPALRDLSHTLICGRGAERTRG